MPPPTSRTSRWPARAVVRARDRVPVPAVVAIVATGIVTAFTAVAPRTAPAQALGDLAILAAAFLACVACLRAARRGGPWARGWALMACSTGTWTAGMLCWTWYGLTRDHVYPFPSLADLGFLGYGVPAMAALLLFPRTSVRQFSAPRMVLDAVVVASSMLFVSWATVLGPVYSAGGSGLARATFLGYPVIDVVIASTVLTLGMRVAPGARRPWLLLGSGLLMLTITDSIYVSMVVAGQGGATGTPLVAGWVGAMLLVAAAAGGRTVSDGRSLRQFTVLQELLPVVPVLAAVLVAALMRFDGGDPFLLVNGAVVLAALAAQQIVVALEKVRLANGLEETVAARTSELRSAEDRYGSLVTSSDEAIFSTTVAGEVTTWNPAAERLYGYPADDIVGRDIGLLVPPELRAEEATTREGAGRGEQVRNQETERRRQDGSLVAVAVTVSPIRAGGVVTGVSVIGHDITERRRQHAELAAAQADALQASRAKSEFLATMSHEIRTPMNGVIGLTGLLLDTGLDEVQRRYATGVRGAGEALLAIIDDILDFSRLEAGKVELEDAPFQPQQLMEEVGMLLAGAAADKRLELVSCCDADVPTLVRGDAGRLRQVLINLASNAIKFTAQGEVVIRARLRESQERHCVLEFSVHDTGIGIDPADAARLFEPFSQADASTTRRFGGTGLGLAICRRLVQALGGEIDAQGTVGVGSTFRFTVPLGLDVETEAAPAAPTTLHGQRVLVVDDNATNRTVLRDQLVAWTLHVDVSDSAATGWQLLQDALAEGRPYDIALLDMCMPDVNGLELATRIFDDPWLAGTRTVILTSAAGSNRAALAAAGVEACLSKPIRSSELHDALVGLVSGEETGPGGYTGSPPALPGTPGERVLVVEDNAVNRMVAEGILHGLGYVVDLAEDGLQALDALSSRRYAAVLMDCHMPELDGFEATIELRRREDGGRRTPVIAMTAGVLEQDRQRCAAAGMDDFVPKPVDSALLRDVLLRWTGTDHDGSGDGPPAPPEPKMQDPPVLDDARLAVLRSLGPPDGWGVLPAVVTAFVSAASAQREAFSAAHREGDTVALTALLHSLSGAAANLGAQRLVGVCEQQHLAVCGGAAPTPADLVAVQRELVAACDRLTQLVPAPA